MEKPPYVAFGLVIVIFVIIFTIFQLDKSLQHKDRTFTLVDVSKSERVFNPDEFTRLTKP